MRGKYYVYALFEETKDNIKYIGYTAKTPIIRFGQHISDCARRKTAKEKWLYSLISAGKHVGVIELGVYSSMDEALAAEETFIDKYGKVHVLTNSTKGGEAGVHGRSKNSRSTHAKTVREAIGVLFKVGITVPTDEQIAMVSGLSSSIVNKYNKRYERKSRSKRKSTR